MHIETPEVIETEVSGAALLLPKWFQRLTAVCAVAIPVAIPLSMYWLEELSSTRNRVETVAFEIASDAMTGIATMRDMVLVVEDIIKLHEAGLATEIGRSGFRARFLRLRDEGRIKTTRTGATISAQLLRFRGHIDDAILKKFAADARFAVNKSIQPFGACVDAMMPLILAGENPQQVFDGCALQRLAEDYLNAAIIVSEESVSLGKHGRYDEGRLRGD